MSASNENHFLLASQLAPPFFALHQISNEISSNGPEFLNEVGIASRKYLQAIREVEVITKDDGLKVMNEIWQLLEIMAIDYRIKGTTFEIMLEDLLKWSSRNNDIVNQLEIQALQSEDQFNCDEFWDIIASNILTGEMKHAADMLSHRPDFSEKNKVLFSIHKLILYRPMFSEFGHSSEYQAEFDRWQNNVIDFIDQTDFDQYPGVEKIAGILAGDEKTIDSCLPLVGQWYRLLISKCFFLCPTADPRLCINSGNMNNLEEENTVMIDLINRIFELETTQVVRDLVKISDSWWMAAHISDILSKLEPDNTELANLRNNCLSQYGENLLRNKDTWLLGLKYSNCLDNVSYEKIEDEILNYDIETNYEAEKVYEIPLRLNLSNSNVIRNKIASKFANLLLLDGDRGSALCWALKAKDEDVCSRIAELEMENYHTTEEWSIPRLVDAIENNSSNIYSEKLLFLSKYKQFYSRIQNKEFFNAAEDLISILACNMTPEILSIVLKQALLLMDEDFTFSRNHIICIMRALQKQKESSRLRNVKLNPTEIEQANLLRKSLAHHLSRSIIQTSS